MPTRIKTRWEARSYDVWGNALDGYEVNNSFRTGEYVLWLTVEINNPGTPHEFLSATPTDTQIRRVLGTPRVQLDTEGDDLTIYVNRARDGYPLGELHCVSHESLSPIRKHSALTETANV